MAYQTYVVKNGDSLSKIAQQQGLSGWGDLYKLNKSLIGNNPNYIRPGWKLNIPGTDKPAPVQTQTQPANNSTIAEQYTAPIVEQAKNIGPQFSKVLPFQDAWGRVVPQATEAAASQINPEVMREYNANNRTLMNNLVNTGGQRFGRGLGQVGDLRAQTERNRQAQMQDWLGAYRQGFSNLFYEPSREAWNSATTLGNTPDQSLKDMPTWKELYGTVNDMSGSSTSPLYG